MNAERYLTWAKLGMPVPAWILYVSNLGRLRHPIYLAPDPDNRLHWLARSMFDYKQVSRLYIKP